MIAELPGSGHALECDVLGCSSTFAAAGKAPRILRAGARAKGWLSVRDADGEHIDYCSRCAAKPNLGELDIKDMPAVLRVTLMPGLAVTAPVADTKTCKDCHQAKPLEDFPEASQGRRLNTCQPCYTLNRKKALAKSQGVRPDTPWLNVKPGEKHCSRCKQVKATADFNKNRATPDGLQYQCRPCAYASEKESKARKQNKHRPGSPAPETKAPRPGMIIALPEPVAVTADSMAADTPAKTCSRCCERKPTTAFSKNSRTPDGLQAYCKPCVWEYTASLRSSRSELVRTCRICQVERPIQEYPENERGRRVKVCTPCHDKRAAEIERARLAAAEQRLKLKALEEEKASEPAPAPVETPIPAASKHCKKCGLDKLMSQFRAHPKTADGLHVFCTPCLEQMDKGFGQVAQPALVTTKQCAKCHKAKPLDQYGDNKRAADNKNRMCKDCYGSAVRIGRWTERQVEEAPSAEPQPSAEDVAAALEIAAEYEAKAKEAEAKAADLMDRLQAQAARVAELEAQVTSSQFLGLEIPRGLEEEVRAGLERVMGADLGQALSVAERVLTYLEKAPNDKQARRSLMKALFTIHANPKRGEIQTGGEFFRVWGFAAYRILENRYGVVYDVDDATQEITIIGFTYGEDRNVIAKFKEAA